jgi:hypothetical protein
LASRITGTWGVAAQVLHQLFELVFGAVRGEIGDLRLEGDRQVGRGIDDGGAKVVDLAGIALQPGGEPGGFGVEAHAQQRAVAALGGAQLVQEDHGAEF